jgi:hypothetical protein
MLATIAPTRPKQSASSLRLLGGCLSISWGDDQCGNDEHKYPENLSSLSGTLSCPLSFIQLHSFRLTLTLVQTPTSIAMRSASTICVLVAAALAPFASASMHSDGVCYDDKGGARVYNEAATIASCGNYKVRNTGGEKWDTCPDCEMVSLLKCGRVNRLTSCRGSLAI